jgi:epsilon-lactone hydrolase
MISKQAQEFWILLKSYPKQIEMPLAQAREADLHAEDFTSEPKGVAFSPAPKVDGLWAEPPNAAPGRSILYFFGGGFVLGTPATRRKTAGHLALAAEARVLVPTYRLAPEHPFPAGLDDAVRAYQFLLDHGVEPSKTVVSGDSAGGGLAVSTVLAVRDRHLPMCAGIAALSPWADLTCSGESIMSRATADIECTRAGLLEMAGWYMKGADPAQPLASPVFANLTGLPLLLCIAGADEELLDDSIRLVRNAGTAGVNATLHIAAGMQHVYPI